MEVKMVNFEILQAELARNAWTIQSLLSGISQVQAQHKPAPDSWSMLEVICHLYDEERDDFRQRLDILLHRPDDKWPPIDPVGWVTERKYNEQDFAAMIKKWSAEREKSLAWLDGLSAPDWDTRHPTPFAFEMAAGDMLASWVTHDTLHMRQLVELRHTHVVNITQPYEIRYAGDW
jgi:uncharacterized damage-inducible protein DinB